MNVLGPVNAKREKLRLSSFSGYNEIQKPCRKNVLIAYRKLMELAGFENYRLFQNAHKKIVNEMLLHRNNSRRPKWTESIAVGSKGFVEDIKEKLRIRSQRRKIVESDGGFELRERRASYIANFDIKISDMGSGNTCF